MDNRVQGKQDKANGDKKKRLLPPEQREINTRISLILLKPEKAHNECYRKHERKLLPYALLVKLELEKLKEERVDEENKRNELEERHEQGQPIVKDSQ